MTDQAIKTRLDPETREFLKEVISEQWDFGYRAAVKILREVADNYPDEKVKATLGDIATLLEKMKP